MAGVSPVNPTLTSKEVKDADQLKRLPEHIERKLGKLRFQNYTPRTEQLKTCRLVVG